jgi:hypothetical protein
MCATGSPVCLLRASSARIMVSEMSHVSVGTMGLLLGAARILASERGKRNITGRRVSDPRIVA